MAAVSDDQEPYDGPYRDDLDALTQELNEPRKVNTFIPKTIPEALADANAKHLEPFMGASGKYFGMKCPVCLAHGRNATAYINDKGAGVLLAECMGCHDDVDHGILHALGAISNGNGAKPDNVVHLHPERANGTHPDPTLIGWVPLDLVTLGDTPRVPPSISGLMYPRRKHIFWGESESGKTWAAIAAAADELKLGNGVIWADLDFMGAQDILERLRQFGVSDDTIRDLFVFYQPDSTLEGYSLDGVIEMLKQRKARLVVIDAFTGLCTLHNLNPEKTMDIDKAYHLCQPFCDLDAAVLVLDHVVKNVDARGQYALGAERKRSGADIAIGFTLIELYGRGKTGRSKLTVHKDRPAMLTRPIAGIFTLVSNPDTHQVVWRLDADASTTEDGKFRPTGYMERISRYLEKFTGSVTRNDILKNVEGKNEHLRSALDCLSSEGFTHEVPGGNKSINVTLVKAFREDEE